MLLAPDEDCDPTPVLSSPKARKFMGRQDAMAVLAAARAFGSAHAGDDVGLYLVVGHIPFEERWLEPVVQGSIDEGAFSMQAFSRAGYRAVPPLLTFQLLPNMPAYHITACLGLRGPYAVLYPGAGQLYLALEQACLDLAAGRARRALVGGVAYQRNFLVRHHLDRVGADPEQARDAAGFVVLEPPQAAAERGATVQGWLHRAETHYTPHDPWQGGLRREESLPIALPGDLGAASLPVALGLAGPGLFHHAVRDRDGVSGESTWEIL